MKVLYVISDVVSILGIIISFFIIRAESALNIVFTGLLLTVIINKTIKNNDEERN